MSESKHRKQYVEALTFFNNAITTSKMYPADAPQVVNATRRSFDGIKNILQEIESLDFAIGRDGWYLQQELLTREELATFPNLVVFRQLSLLGKGILRFTRQLDRFAFNQLMLIFTAPADKIQKAGGGSAFIATLGLSHFFPNTAGDIITAGETHKKTLVVRPALVACLLGKDDRPLVIAELEKKMQDTHQAVEIIAAATGRLLKAISEKHKAGPSALFPQLMRNSSKLITKELQPEIINRLVSLLLKTLNDSALFVFCSQRYQRMPDDALGKEMLQALFAEISIERFGRIIDLFRKQLRAEDQSDAKLYLVQKQTLEDILATQKGKQFLVKEKTKNIIEEGEQERRKKRMEAGISRLISGDIKIYNNEELISYLPGAVCLLLGSAKRSHGMKILSTICTHLQNAPAHEGEKALRCLVMITDKLVEHNEYDGISVLLNTLLLEAEKNSCNLELFTSSINVLQRVMQGYWSAGDFTKGDLILKFLHQMRQGHDLEKPATFKKTVAKVQDDSVDRTVLPDLFKRSLVNYNNPWDGERLIMMGPVVIRYLVEALTTVEKANVRDHLISILEKGGTVAAESAEERLSWHMPWYGKRNLLQLLAALGTKNTITTIAPLLKHTDFRVQREAVAAISRLGDKEDLKELLLPLLDTTREELQIEIIKALTRYGDREIAARFVERLDFRTYFSETNLERILLSLIDGLSHCVCTEALNGLKAFYDSRELKTNKIISQKVWQRTRQCIAFINSEIRENRKKQQNIIQIRKNALKQAGNLLRPGGTLGIITGLKEEQNIRLLLADNKKGEAIAELARLIEKTARERKFIQVGKLRKWLLEIAPDAFEIILELDEIIDREKGLELTNGHLDIWSSLYDTLTTEEFEVLFEALIHSEHDAGELLIAQGAMQNSLLFVNNGRVRLHFKGDEGDVVVKTVSQGEVFGAGSFFDASIWTLSATTVTASDISILRHDRVSDWDTRFPEMEEKLRKFCMEHSGVDKHLDEKLKNRRKYHRFTGSGKVSAVLLDSHGSEIGVPREYDIFDISEGGLSYLNRRNMSQRQRKQILGQKMNLEFTGKSGQKLYSMTGDVIAVKNQPNAKALSLHIKFDSLLDKKIMELFIEKSDV